MKTIDKHKFKFTKRCFDKLRQYPSKIIATKLIYEQAKNSCDSSMSR